MIYSKIGLKMKKKCNTKYELWGYPMKLQNFKLCQTQRWGTIKPQVFGVKIFEIFDKVFFFIGSFFKKKKLTYIEKL